jgi:glutathione peroxidase-family protein
MAKKVYELPQKMFNAKDEGGCKIMGHPFNRYQNYEQETNQDEREYKKRQYEREERYWQDISRENERLLNREKRPFAHGGDYDWER